MINAIRDLANNYSLAGLLKHAGFISHQLWTRRFVHEWTVEKLLTTQTQCGLASRRLTSLSAEAPGTCVNGVRVRLEKVTADESEYRAEITYAVLGRP